MRVTADRAFAASRDGELVAFEAGDVAEGDWAEYLATTGAPVTAVEEASGESGDAATPPAPSAPKTAWVEHAVAQGADEAAAAAMTKAALIEAHGPTTE